MHSCTEVRGQFCQIKKEQKLEKRRAERFPGSVRHPDLPVLLFQKKNGTMITDVEWIRGGVYFINVSFSCIELYLAIVV